MNNYYIYKHADEHDPVLSKPDGMNTLYAGTVFDASQDIVLTNARFKILGNAKDRKGNSVYFIAIGSITVLTVEPEHLLDKTAQSTLR